jgi:hypothetical protein
LRLGNGRFICLVVASTPITDKINNDIAFKRIPEINRELRDKNDSFWIIGIDMENGGLNHLSDIGAILSRTSINTLTSGKAHLIV